MCSPLEMYACTNIHIHVYMHEEFRPLRYSASIYMLTYIHTYIQGFRRHQHTLLIHAEVCMKASALIYDPRFVHCMCICLSICLSLCLSIYLSFWLSVLCAWKHRHSYMIQGLCMYVHMPFYLSVSLSIYLSICLIVCAVCMKASILIYDPRFVHVCAYVYLSICLSVCLSVLCVCMVLCM